jgi:A/G-specific adenine glycosylase
MNASKLTLKKFQQTVADYYQKFGRDLPWRHTEDPYRILVSEIMLQQTQVSRVIPKYVEFLNIFPTAQSLADATLGDALRAWSGLGYNRRAKYLHEAVKKLRAWTYDELVACTGIGPNTAAAVCVYAYNEPRVFIETNVRSVFIHHFFQGSASVADKEILSLVEVALNKENPRKWYWALMDYGTHLKSIHGNPNRVSRHYAKQSKFVGSERQIRGQVIRLLSQEKLDHKALTKTIIDDRLEKVLQDLYQEGLIERVGSSYQLTT